jgi:phosphohistidine phosphatase
MRHGKAEAFAASDHERVLTKRGLADATEAGTWARAAGVVPDLAYVSSSARTQGTWAAFCAGSGCEAEAIVDRSIYAAGTDAVLEILRAAPDEARRVIVVGHNPTMAYLVHLLDDGGADPDLFAELSAGYPTSALTVLSIEGDWADLDVAGARITSFHVGRG